MKHKHYDMIIAWANGAEIQWKDPKYKLDWHDIEHPHFFVEYEYRIKPEEKQPVVRWLWAYKTPSGWVSTSSFYTEGEAEYTKWERVKLEYTRQEFPE
jgi:hypothetical protein